MFVYFFDFRKLKRRAEFMLTSICIVLLITLTFSAINGYYKEKSVSVLADGANTVIIDAGHGGEDVGATGVSGVYEKDLNLIICSMIGEQLKEQGYTVIYTRTEDKLLYTEDEDIHGIRKISDLKNRCKIANQYPEAIFVSIHMNKYGDSKYSGLQVYYKDKSDGSYALANKIQSTVKDKLQPENNRQVKNGKGLYILDNSTLSSVIVECGFLSNVEECEKLSQKEYQKQLSFSIACGIIDYIKNCNA